MKKRKILMLLIIILGMFIFFRNISFNNISYRLNKFVSKITNTSEYKTIKQDINKNYSGIGQEKVKNKDGYFTTFTTIENHKNIERELNSRVNISLDERDYIKKLAISERDAIINDARKNANRIISDALIRAEKTEHETQMLKNNISLFKSKVKSMLNEQLEIVDKIDNIL